MTKKVCFVSLGAYPLLTGATSDIPLGPDIHQVLLAKELIQNNIPVCIVCYGNKNEKKQKVSGIEVISILRIKKHFIFLTNISLFVNLLGAMKKSNSDIYIQANGIPLIIALFCKILGKKYIYEIASDDQVDENLTNFLNTISKTKKITKKYGNRLNIIFSDILIVQTRFQKQKLIEYFKKDSNLIRMSFPIEKYSFDKTNDIVVLWVGSITEVKQPMLFLEIAEKFPKIKFIMIGGAMNHETGFFLKFIKKIENIQNLEYLGPVNFDKINYFFKKSSILVNTSIYEGFPNAFIQAWMYYNPVISLNVNPDNIIIENKLGFHSKNFENLVNDLKTLIDNPELRNKMANSCREYVEQNHNIEANIFQYIELL